MIYVAKLWQFRSFIVGSVLRELQARYRNSLLGVAWVALPALAQIAIYTLIFSQLIAARLPGVDDVLGYSIYLCAGIIAWSLFAELLSRNISVFLDHGSLIKKLLFPKICLPAVVIFNALINYGVLIVLFVFFLVFTDRFPGAVLLGVVPLLVVQVMLAAGLGIALGVINVFFRDVGQLTQIVMQFWFWLTPIVYPLSILPDAARSIVMLNPLTSLVAGYQQIFVYHTWPAWGTLIYPLAVSVLFLGTAFAVYRRNVLHIVDEL